MALLVISNKGRLYVGPGLQEELAVELQQDSQKCYLLVFQWHKSSLSLKVSLHPSFNVRLAQTPRFCCVQRRAQV